VSPPGRRVDAATVRVLDAVALLWCAVWLVLAVWIGAQVWQLADLGTTLASTGRALDDSGRALQELRDLPVIGNAPGSIGDSIRENAADIVARGGETRDSTRRLAVLVGVGAFLLPLTPVLLYVPVRVGARRDRRRVRTLVDRLDPGELDSHLARRALANVRYDRLLQVSPAPEGDFEAGRRTALADAELARIGLRRTRG